MRRNKIYNDDDHGRHWALDVAGHADHDGAGVIIFPSHGLINQKFRIVYSDEEFSVSGLPHNSTFYME